MKSILIISYSILHFGITKYLFSQKRIAQQATKKITHPFLVIRWSFILPLYLGTIHLIPHSATYKQTA